MVFALIPSIVAISLTAYNFSISVVRFWTWKQVQFAHLSDEVGYRGKTKSTIWDIIVRLLVAIQVEISHS